MTQDILMADNEPVAVTDASCRQLKQFCVAAKSATDAQLLDLLRQVLETPSIYVFAELLALPNVQELKQGQHAKYYNTLDLFAYGTYKQYRQKPDDYLELSPAMQKKLQHLTIVSLAIKNKCIPYEVLLEELEIDNVRHLEDIIIEAIYAGRITFCALLGPVQPVVHVNSLTKFPQGNTAMHYAVSHGNFDVVSILLDSKVCNVNQMNNAGYTCVMLVSLTKVKNTAHRTVVQRLFQMADVNIRAKKHSQTALMLAVSHFNMEMVQLLLEAGADINIQDDDGSTALMGAAEIGRVDMVKQLLSQPDCDSLITDADGATAFKIAWKAGHREIGFILYVHEQMLRNKSVTSEEHPMNTSYTLPGPSEHLAE